jgi:hypothetical protein
MTQRLLKKVLRALLMPDTLSNLSPDDLIELDSFLFGLFHSCTFSQFARIFSPICVNFHCSIEFLTAIVRLTLIVDDYIRVNIRCALKASVLGFTLCLWVRRISKGRDLLTLSVDKVQSISGWRATLFSFSEF